MIAIELKRRMTWLWRLTRSRLLDYGNAGENPALWVYDTQHQPDGAVLKEYVELVARREGLRLQSFGPHNSSLPRFIKSVAIFLLRFNLVFRRDFDTQLGHLVQRTLVTAMTSTCPKILLVGSSKGTFAQAVSQLGDISRIWEVQHGLLDPSYFPMNIERFFARSRTSAEIVRQFAPNVTVELISEKLDPPRGQLVRINLSAVKQLACYSKNPGGGCTATELAEFELLCSNIAQRMGFVFLLYLHPRDNLFKLLYRHRSIKPALWVFREYTSRPADKRLFVSAYSTALVHNTHKGDLIINVKIGNPDEVILHEYQWVPTYTLSDLASLPEQVDAFDRTS